MYTQVKLLEWTDDMEMFIVKGYGNSLNYRMGVSLLDDVILSMENAIKAKEGNCVGNLDQFDFLLLLMRYLYSK